MKFTKLLALGSAVFMVCGISLADATSSTSATTTAPTTTTSGANGQSDVSPN